MKYLLLGTIFALGCVSIMQPHKGQYCYSWGDREGMGHETCRATEDTCRESLDNLTTKRSYYQTNSDCDLR